MSDLAEMVEVAVSLKCLLLFGRPLEKLVSLDNRVAENQKELRGQFPRMWEEERDEEILGLVG